MRSSTSQRDRVWIGLALACPLGLGGALLLLQAQPILPRLSDWRDAGAVEVRRAARDVEAEAQISRPDDAPAPPSRFARVAAPLKAQFFAPLPQPDTDWDANGNTETPPPTPPPAATPAPARPYVDLGGVLRTSGLACLDGREALLSPDERELCRERLGATTWKAASPPPSIEPEERAAYDAAVQAQAPRRALVPLQARGAGGAFAGEDRGRSSRSPRLGCRIRFGLNADRKPEGAENAQDANPCFAGLR